MWLAVSMFERTWWSCHPLMARSTLPKYPNSQTMRSCRARHCHRNQTKLIYKDIKRVQCGAIWCNACELLRNSKRSVRRKQFGPQWIRNHKKMLINLIMCQNHKLHSRANIPCEDHVTTTQLLGMRLWLSWRETDWRRNAWPRWCANVLRSVKKRWMIMWNPFFFHIESISVWMLDRYCKYIVSICPKQKTSTSPGRKDQEKWTSDRETFHQGLWHGAVQLWKGQEMDMRSLNTGHLPGLALE